MKCFFPYLTPTSYLKSEKPFTWKQGAIYCIYFLTENLSGSMVEWRRNGNISKCRSMSNFGVGGVGQKMTWVENFGVGGMGP